MARSIVPIIEPNQADTIVVKSNFLARCRWEISTIYEARMVAVLASKIRMEDVDFQSYYVPVSEILGPKYSGQDVKKFASAVDNLLGRVLTIFDADGRGWTKYTLFVRCRFQPGKGTVELQFHPDLKCQYLQLRGYFTEYPLAEFLSLPSIYSQRMYEILRSWDDRLEVTYLLEDLYEMLNIPESYRKDFRKFRVKVLEKAHHDIAEHAGSTLRYRWEAVKEKNGRSGKVTKIRFIFEKPTAQKLIALPESAAGPREGSLQHVGDLAAQVLSAKKSPSAKSRSSRSRSPSASRQKSSSAAYVKAKPTPPESSKPATQVTVKVETPLMRETRECYNGTTCPNLAKRVDEVAEPLCVGCMTSGYLDHIRSAERSLRRGKEEFPFMRSIPCFISTLPEDVNLNPAASPA